MGGAGPEDHIQVDLADPADAERAIAEIRSRLPAGELHALVNNAGISPKGPGGARLDTLETELATWMRVFQVNFFAPICWRVASWGSLRRRRARW